MMLLKGGRTARCAGARMIEGKVGSTQYYVPIAFTHEEIERIRLLLRGIDKQVGRYSLSHIVVTKLINKCDAILKGAAGVNELHLFAGAGGGILGGMLLEHTCVCAVEIEPYCRKVLLQRQRDGMLPKFPIWDDVRTFGRQAVERKNRHHLWRIPLPRHILRRKGRGNRRREKRIVV